MPPKNFADDGAAGAFGGGSDSGGAIGPDIVQDFGSPQTNFGASNSGASSSPFGNIGANDLPGQNGKMVNVNTSRGGYTQPTANPADMSKLFGPAAAGDGTLPAGAGFSFADGGAVPDDSDGSPEQDMMAKALESVDQTLQYTYKKYGLTGGGQDEGNGAINTAAAMPTIPGNQSETPGPYVPQTKPQKMAQASYQNNRMPMIPGSQSNSGVPPIQPAPGPLPPTSNPFGKRADNDSDDSAGAIDTDEDTA